MDADAAVNESMKVPDGFKHFFLAICRMHEENNFNRFESVKIHNKVDDLAKEAEKKERESQKIIISNPDHSKQIDEISKKIQELADVNSKLMGQLDKLVNENNFLKEKMHKFEKVPVVKLMPKKEGNEPLIITQDEYNHIRELKDKIFTLEKRYDVLLKEENYDDKLLLNHRERIEILREKLRVASLGKQGA